MVKNHMMEDAVGLYLQLGKDYPDVVIRNGKTGAMFTTALLTDKRLLPYLEPSRYPMPARVKAAQRERQDGRTFNSQFEVEPRGELFPTYRRYRFLSTRWPPATAVGRSGQSTAPPGSTKWHYSGLTPPQMSQRRHPEFLQLLPGQRPTLAGPARVDGLLPRPGRKEGALAEEPAGRVGRGAD